MKKKIFIIICLIIITLLSLVIDYFELKKNNIKPSINPIKNEAMSPEEAKFWDSLQNTNIKIEDVILPNGEKMLDFLCEHDKEFLSKFDPNDLSKCNN